MAHKFNMVFKKGWITRIGTNLIRKAFTSSREDFHPATKKCYEYVFLNWNDRSPDNIQLAPVKLYHHKWLFGPATKLKSKSIVYPCSRGKCSLPCPCLLCHKKVPVCRAGCDCEECKLYEEDHNNYHGCFHNNCTSCNRLIKQDGYIDFSLFDKSRKPINMGINTEEILRPSFKLSPYPRRPRPDMLESYLASEKWSERKTNFLRGIEDDSLWCFLCSTLFFHEDVLKLHVLEHGVSKMFRHDFENATWR